MASDSHGASRRGPGLRTGFEALEEELPGLRDQSDWYTTHVPSAVITGAALPARRPGLVRRGKRRRQVQRAFRRLLAPSST